MLDTAAIFSRRFLLLTVMMGLICVSVLRNRSLVSVLQCYLHKNAPTMSCAIIKLY